MKIIFPTLQNFFVAASDTARPVLSELVNASFARLRLAKTSTEQNRVKSAMKLNRMARDIESSQPSLAAELRNFASR